jgi:hypothetical protein
MTTFWKLFWPGALCGCVAGLCFIGCSSTGSQSAAGREVLVKAVLEKVQLGRGFNYDTVGVVQVSDGETRQQRQLCYLFGGPPTSTSGAVGVFDSTGQLLDARQLKGFYGFETNANVFAQNDSVVLRTVDAAGTGLHEESFIVLTLNGGRLLETLRCPGLSYSTHGEFYDQTVQLAFRESSGQGNREIVRLVKSNRYDSAAEQESGKPATTKSFSEIFRFDAKAGRYLRAPE